MIPSDPLAAICGFQIDGGGVKTQASYSSLIELDERLAGLGFHPLSDWWRAEAQRFYSHPTALTWGARVGRGGAKSTCICKVALNEVLNSRWDIPPGEIHYFAIVAESKEEATNRLVLLEGFLKALKIEYRRSGPTITLSHLRLGFKVLACRIGAVSGFRAVGRSADEVAKWNDEGTDPSEEIMASMAAMTVTHVRARSLIFSSPMGMAGLHYSLIEGGDTDKQVISIAPSWIANPAISESHTHSLAENDRVWKREYAAIPQGSLTAVFDPIAIDRAFENGERWILDSQSSSDVLILDPSRGTDAWAYAIARWVWSNNKPRLRVREIGETPEIQPGEDFTEKSVSWLCEKARSNNIGIIIADQYEAGALKVLFGQSGLTYYEYPWTSGSKKIAVDRLDRYLRDSVLMLSCVSGKLRTQLLEYSERISKSGELTYGGRGKHDDYAQVLLTLCMADADNKLEMADAPVTTNAYGTKEYWKHKEDEIERGLEEKAMRQRRERMEEW